MNDENAKLFFLPFFSLVKHKKSKFERRIFFGFETLARTLLAHCSIIGSIVRIHSDLGGHQRWGWEAVKVEAAKVEVEAVKVEAAKVEVEAVKVEVEVEALEGRHFSLFSPLDQQRSRCRCCLPLRSASRAFAAVIHHCYSNDTGSTYDATYFAASLASFAAEGETKSALASAYTRAPSPGPSVTVARIHSFLPSHLSTSAVTSSSFPPPPPPSESLASFWIMRR